MTVTSTSKTSNDIFYLMYSSNMTMTVANITVLTFLT
jgi:hypothetical protein